MDTSAPPDPQGWPGVFRPLRHWVLPSARRIQVRGYSAYFAECTSLCWPPVTSGIHPATLPWCPDCLRYKGI